MVIDRGEVGFKSHYPLPSLCRLSSPSFRLFLMAIFCVSLLAPTTTSVAFTCLQRHSVQERKHCFQISLDFSFLPFLACPFLLSPSLLQRRLRCWRRAIGFMGEGERGLARSWWGWGEGLKRGGRCRGIFCHGLPPPPVAGGGWWGQRRPKSGAGYIPHFCVLPGSSPGTLFHLCIVLPRSLVMNTYVLLLPSCFHLLIVYFSGKYTDLKVLF